MQMGILVNFLNELLDTSREIIRPYFTAPDLQMETKEDGTPVTIADRETERVLREKIRRTYPDHGIIGEEFGNEREEAEYVWVLDPIDGTKSFISGVPLFGTLIGLLKNGTPLLGAIDQPILEQRMTGDGEQTLLNGKPAHIRKTASLAEATLLSTDPLEPSRIWNSDAWSDLTNRVRLYRTWGDCYGYLLLAAGKGDIMIDPIVSKWDFLPIIPIIRGAGGTITDWMGNDPIKGNSIIASSPGIHAEIIQILNQGTPGH
jgi:histidinol phosphatase-like enzyme (inositol monophosphatase family)